MVCDILGQVVTQCCWDGSKRRRKPKVVEEEIESGRKMVRKGERYRKRISGGIPCRKGMSKEERRKSGVLTPWLGFFSLVLVFMGWASQCKNNSYHICEGCGPCRRHPNVVAFLQIIIEL